MGDEGAAVVASVDEARLDDLSVRDILGIVGDMGAAAANATSELASDLAFMAKARRHGEGNSSRRSSPNMHSPRPGRQSSSPNPLDKQPSSPSPVAEEKEWEDVEQGGSSASYPRKGLESVDRRDLINPFPPLN